ncbi:MAG: hypothetical protein MUE40_03600, partial [Anaerolineae bacterium]|nr:hypothetical protein [Anaerolineae bacterium]
MPAWLRQFTIDRAALGIMVLLLVAMATRAPVDTDTWWHLRSGDYTLTQGMIHGDPFSHTQAGAVWINHSWGAQLILLAAYRLAGDAGLALYQTLLAVGGLLLLYRAGAGSVYLRAFVLIAGAAAASVFWSARPQMLSFFCTCALLWIVLTWQRGGRDRLWWLVPLLLLWGNLHAGYAIGFLFLGATLAGETLNRLTGTGGVPPAALRKLLLVTLAGAAALLINPYGLDLLLVPFQTVGIGALRAFIQEWNSPDFQGRETWPFIALVVALFGAAWGSRL